jgi:acetoin utilization protein AcuC
VSGTAAYVYSPELRQYDHGPLHPLKPERFTLARELSEVCGLLSAPDVLDLPARPARDEEIATCHSTRYIEAVRAAGEGAPGRWEAFGFGPGDNPIFARMHDAAAWVVGATLEAARAIAEGRALHAFSPAGGLHHAMPEQAWGFCIYNDPAIAIRWLLRQGFQRVAYIDLDVHHGDGVQAIFYREPRVLTISIHESGQFLFPGTGFVDEIGEGPAEGTKVNVPLPPGTADPEWLLSIDEIVLPLVRAWRPDILVTQLGCDTHATDPLAHFELSTFAYREAYARMHALAHEVAGGRWLATGGGGYQWAAVAPRAWTLAFAEMVGRELPETVPEAWAASVAERYGVDVPRPFVEEQARPGAYAHHVRRVLQAVKAAVFRYHGLDGES